AGAVGYERQTGRPVVFHAKAVVLATGGIGKAWRVTSNSWEYTGDGIAMALGAGAELINMEMTQFHPTGMVWPLSVRGLLVTEGVRGDGGTLKNNKGERFMFNYIPPFFAAETADNEKEADAWYADKKNNRRTPDLLPRDEVARAINAEVKAGRGTEHGGVFLDIASRRPADYIKKRLPSMYHQFMQLAGVDITKEPMEIAPTYHYLMGGIKVDPDSQQSTLPGLFAAGECAAGLHGANRLGGNSLSDLVVFGRRAGLYAAEYAKRLARMPMLDDAQVQAAERDLSAPLARHEGENPYAIQSELQDTMQTLVGIIRTKSELEQAVVRLDALAMRAERAATKGGRTYNPSWHTALDIRSQLVCAMTVAKSALTREESRGGHTREDFPKADAAWGKKIVVTRKRGDGIEIGIEPTAEVPAELQALLGEDKPAGTAAVGATAGGA
ncbi:MAG TPA: FAD-binding protein, partial [Candidatus Limnocylindria bacterium]